MNQEAQMFDIWNIRNVLYIVAHSYSQEHLIQEDLNVGTSTDICCPNTVNNYNLWLFHSTDVLSFYSDLSIFLSMFLKTSQS